VAGTRVGDITWPPDTALVAIIRQERPIAPSRDDALEAGDQLFFLTVPESEDQLQLLLMPSAVSKST
jgi:trk system potassium uptake protein TrkA